MDKTLAEILEKLTQAIKQQSAPTSTTTPPAQNITLPDIHPFSTENVEEFEEWLERFQFALDCAAANMADEAKVKLLMTKLNPAAFGEYKRYCLPEEITKFNFTDTKSRLIKLFSHPPSLAINRYECLRVCRENGENFEIFVNRLKASLRKFRFSELNEQEFKCLVLLTSLKSPSDAKLRQHILARLTAEDSKTTKTAKLFDKVVEEMNTLLKTEAEAKILEEPKPKINAIQHGKSSPNKHQNRGNGRPNQKFTGKSKAKIPPSNCYRCGELHWALDCPKKENICRKCNRRGHIDRQCDKIRAFHQNKGRNFNTNTVMLPAAYINSVHSSNLLKAPINVNGTTIGFILDSGAEIIIINEDDYNAMGRPPIQICSEEARFFDGKRCKFIGRGTATFQFNGIQTIQPFYVAKSGSLNLLGTPAMEAFGFLEEIRRMISPAQINQISSNDAAKIQQFVEILPQKYEQIFSDGLGFCSKMKANLMLKEGANPTFKRARPVPYSTLPIINAELDRLEKLKVITPVEHTDWSAPILVVKKANGTARLCADFSTGLNDSLQLNQHPLPLPADIFATLNGGKFFTKLDLSDAYLQIELDVESKKLCTIATHRGHFQYERLPFGVKSAPGIFQSVMDNMLSDFPFALAYLDDVIIVSATFDQHCQHLNQIFTRISEWGFKVRMDKCSFFKNEIKYLGVIIDQSGRRPDPSKITAIAEMRIPSNVSELRSYLGMVNYYQEFVRNFRFIRQPLDELLKKDAKWDWSPKCQNAFTKIISMLQSELALTHFDPNLPIIVAADASQHGIGGVISHKFANGSIKAVSHFSRSLTPAEQNYGQIEKEALALVEAVKRFHKMIFGRNFTLLTDHQPLNKIFGNKDGVPKHSHNRLVRWSLILTAYDFEIQYVKTDKFGQADALSRLISVQKSKSDDDEVIIASFEVESVLDRNLINNVNQLPITFKNLAQETANDQALQQIRQFVKNIWPEPKNFQPIEGLDEAKFIQFYRRRDEISIVKDCLMFGDRTIIPKSLQKQILKMLHQGHPGVKRMKSLARMHVYWPMMDAEIETFVQKCTSCAAVAKNPIKTTLQSWPKSDGPWKRIHIDYAGPFHGKMYLIVVDSFSKYPEIFEMNSTNAMATISKMRSLIAHYGIPETIVSDNGTQFQSHQFQNFVKSNGIEHIFTAPYMPQSNGQAERMVDTFKRAFAKIKGEGVDGNVLDTFLLTYRTTPSETLDGKCPAELFLGRKPRIGLDLLRPPLSIPIVKDNKMEDQFNRKHGAKLRSFEIGQLVFTRRHNSAEWRHGKIIDKKGVIYTVELPNNSRGRFHANQIRARQIPDEDIEDPLDVINGTFGLPIPLRDQNLAEVPPANQSPPVRRYPIRNRRPVDRLQIDPSRSSYV